MTTDLEQLAADCRQNPTPAARERLARGVRPLLVRALRSRLRPVGITLDDLVQAALPRVVAAAERYRPERGAASTFFVVQARFAVLDWLRDVDPLGRKYRQAVNRGQAPDLQVLPLGEPGSPLGRAADAARMTDPAPLLDARLDAAAALDTLPPQDRAILARHVAGETARELAGVFGLSASGIEARIRKARQQLRRRFPELDPRPDCRHADPPDDRRPDRPGADGRDGPGPPAGDRAPRHRGRGRGPRLCGWSPFGLQVYRPARRAAEGPPAASGKAG